MGQIVAYAKNERGNYVIEVKPAIRHNRRRTTQVAGTDWNESLPGLFAEAPDGTRVPLEANVSIRYHNTFKPGPDIVVIPTMSKADGTPLKGIIPFRK